LSAIVLSMRGRGRPVGLGLGVGVRVGSGVALVLTGVLGGADEGCGLGVGVGVVGTGPPLHPAKPPNATPAAPSRTVRRVSTPRFSCGAETGAQDCRKRPSDVSCKSRRYS
jgi:hypothetical protein